MTIYAALLMITNIILLISCKYQLYKEVPKYIITCLKRIVGAQLRRSIFVDYHYEVRYVAVADFTHTNFTMRILSQYYLLVPIKQTDR